MCDIDQRIIELENKLAEKDDELKKLNKLLVKIGREKDQSNKFNNELRNQIELLNAKLHVHQKIKINVEQIDKETQTNFNELYKSSDELKKEQNDDGHDENSWRVKSEKSNTRIADLVRETAETVLNINDYIYDEKSKTYYSQSSGWYFYPDRSLFYDPHTKNYYKYDYEKKSYSFYSSLVDSSNKRKKEKRKSSEKKKSKQENNISEKVIDCTCSDDEKEKEQNERDKSEEETDNDNNNDDDEDDDEEEEEEEEEEEGEISSSESDNDIQFIDLKGEEKIDYGPPCVRMIVIESTTLDEGSLLLITCMGGRIGNDPKADVWITDESVSKYHAEVKYEECVKNYVIKDLNSINGTYKNGIKLNGEISELRHGDEICFGDCKVLIHIHEGRDVTCNNCEPGLVQANLKNTNNILVKTSLQNEKERKIFLKQMKKRYGLANIDYSDKSFNPPIDYHDRAEQRRQTVGSDNPYEKTDVNSTSTNKHIKESNKGFKMLEKMGWKLGESLGKSQTGDTEPININVNENRVGLGSSSQTTFENSFVSLSQSNNKKTTRLKKTQQRFNQLT